MTSESVPTPDSNPDPKTDHPNTDHQNTGSTERSNEAPVKGFAADPVTVIGLGSMGAALARALLAAGAPTTVWNRTAKRAEPLAAAGASVASDPGAAMTASDLIIICLRDHEAVLEVLSTIAPEQLRGRTVVNLSSSTPGQARRSAAWASERQITYLNGVIMVPTPMIGTSGAVILYGGARDAFDPSEPQLRALAGINDHLGEDPGLAALYDVGMLEIFFAAMASFLHAAALITSHGITAKAFLPYAKQMAALGGTVFDGLAADVDAGQHDGTEDNLEMELAALDHIVAASDEAGLDGGLAKQLQLLAARAVSAGHGADSFSRVVEPIRQPD